ncbi:hypothetical protein Tco_1543035 [Tanacetum coccineum]
MDGLEMNIGRRALNESECLVKAQEVRAIKEIEKRLNKSKNGSSSSGHAVDAERARVNKVVSNKENAAVGPAFDNNTLTGWKTVLRKNELEKTNQDFLKQLNDLNNKLLKARQTAQTFHMLLLKEDNVNTGKQSLSFENQNDVDNPFILNKAKELTPSLYNIDEMGKDLLSDQKIISEEELKCEAEKHLKVKQIKSPLSYHGFVYGETQFEEPPKVPLKRREVNLKKHSEQAQLVNYDPKL